MKNRPKIDLKEFEFYKKAENLGWHLFIDTYFGF